MKRLMFMVFVIAGVLFTSACSTGKRIKVSSPDGQIVAILMVDEETGVLTYKVLSGEREIIKESPIGITTNMGNFQSGTKYEGSSAKVIDETYTLRIRLVKTQKIGKNYKSLSFRDDTDSTMLREPQTVSQSTNLTIGMHERGGFAIHLSPN